MEYIFLSLDERKMAWREAKRRYAEDRDCKYSDHRAHAFDSAILPDYLGILGEAAFSKFTPTAIPGPKFAGWDFTVEGVKIQVKGCDRPGRNLVIHPKSKTECDIIVLVEPEGFENWGRVFFVGQISLKDYFTKRKWIDWMPVPCWLVKRGDLDIITGRD